MHLKRPFLWKMPHAPCPCQTKVMNLLCESIHRWLGDLGFLDQIWWLYPESGKVNYIIGGTLDTKNTAMKMTHAKHGGSLLNGSDDSAKTWEALRSHLE